MNTLRNKTDRPHTTYGSTRLALALIAGALLMTPETTQAQIKGSALPVAETLTLADRVMMVTDPSGTPTTKTATLTLLKATMAAGSGDVVGPASAVNNRVVFFEGTTGKLIKDSGLTLSGTNTGDQDLSSYLTSSTAATTYQPLNSQLDAIAALTTTTTGRSLLEAADAAAIRTIAGLGTAATATIATAVTNNAVPTIHNAAGSPDRAITGISATGKIVFSTATGTGSPVWGTSPTLLGSPKIGAGSGSFSSLQFYDSNGGGGDNFIGLRAPNSMGSDLTLILPGADGTNGQALVTNGSGALSFATVGVSDGDKGSITVSSSGTVWTIDASAVTDSMLAGSISPSKVTGTAAILGANTFTEKQTINVASGTPLEIQIAGVKKFEFSSNGGLLIADSSTWLPYGVDGNFYFGGRGIFRQNSGGVNSITIDASDSTPENQSIGFYIGASMVSGVFCGAGSPEGVKAAPPGSLYFNRSGGAGATLYVKESGSGNTGWIAK